MSRRNYGQEACSVACALDRIGERWSLLIVRELSLGPSRFSDLVRSVGGAPTDVLTKRLRDLERDGIVRRRELGPPASATVYELTDLGRGLERPLVELGRWGLNLQQPSDVAGLEPSSLPNALRIVLQPPREASLTLGLHTGGEAYRLRVEDGWIEAARGEAEDADLTLAGTPWEVMSTLVAREDGEAGAEVDGDPEALEALREMVVLPDHLGTDPLDALAAAGSVAAATARTA
jgi:DNA-binding HxlR family transcriptional regulator